MNVVVAGAGFVGLANALLIGLKHSVTVYDIDSARVAKINSKVPTVADPLAEKMILESTIQASCDPSVFANADCVLIATPTDYSSAAGYFDTSSIESVLNLVAPTSLVIIRSTLPVGYVSSLKGKYKNDIVFCPEFLREGSAMNDTINPTRVVVGNCGKVGSLAADLLTESLIDPPSVIFTGPTEAESIKLFANSYLATRVAYFNELDTFCIETGLDARSIIEGVCADPRIGAHYNNPSFGYGGYCLPKDTKQLAANFEKIPCSIIPAIVSSNRIRAAFIAKDVMRRNPKVIGIYSMAMKAGSDNSRESAIANVIEYIALSHPSVQFLYYSGEDLEIFCSKSDLILVNRNEPALSHVKQKVYTRDVFGTD